MNVSGPQVVAETAAPTLRLPPAPEQIRAELERIVASPDFPVPARACAFLRYVVEETLAGRAARIKGYSIATDVFHRDEGFTQEDPVVRIEAGRLRRALERYFLLAGQSDPIRIEIPKGGYVPVFSWSGSNEIVRAPSEPILIEAAVAPAISKKPSVTWEKAHWLATAALAILLGITTFAYWASSRPAPDVSVPQQRALAPQGPTLVIAPFAEIGESPETKIYAIGLTEELLSILPRFKELTVFGRETSQTLSPAVDASEVRKQLGARYLLSGAVQISNSRIHVTVHLIETDTNAILWSQSYNDDLLSRDILAIQSDIAAQVATVVAQPYGIIYQADAAGAAPPDLGAYRCTLQFYAYREQLSPEQHAVVRDCLEQAIAKFPDYATAWSMLSIVYLDEDRFEFNRRAGSPTPLERSLVAARRAVELDSHNMRALQALMNALFFNQQLAESLQVGEKALAINPNDTEFIGEFGARVAIGGQWQRGAALLRSALARNSGNAGYYHTVLALCAYMLQDGPTALAEIRQANVDKFPIFHIVAAVIYSQNGLAADATREANEFIKLRPGFLQNIDADLKKRNVQPGDRSRIIADLGKAGFLPGSDAASNASNRP